MAVPDFGRREMRLLETIDWQSNRHADGSGRGTITTSAGLRLVKGRIIASKTARACN
jgi:hypothetical protein